MVYAQPDIVHLQVGVETQKDTLQAAQDETSVKASAIVSGLVKSGVAEQDIRTSTYSVMPVTSTPDNQGSAAQAQAPTVVGFRVTEIFDVTIRDMKKGGQIIDSLVSSGANHIYGLSFDFSDPAKLTEQAREAAMNDARTRAQQLARAGGVSLGDLLMVEESTGNVTPIRDTAGTVGTGGQATPPINPGEQSVRVQVSVMFGIR